MGQIAVFRMVEDDVLDVQALGQFTGVFDGGMIFRRVENGFVGIEAEGFVKEPLAALDVSSSQGWHGCRRSRSGGRRQVPWQSRTVWPWSSDVEAEGDVMADEVACRRLDNDQMELVIEVAAVLEERTSPWSRRPMTSSWA